MTMEKKWIVSVARSTDWLPFQVALIERLLDKGLAVTVGYSRWEVEIDEWIVFVSSIAAVWAAFSRWSEYSWMMRAVYTVRIRRSDREKWNYVQLRVDNGGVRYGCISC